MSSLRVLHSSDIHGRYKMLLRMQEPFDVWLETGDFFPNRGRVRSTGYIIEPEMERRYQLRWWRLKQLGRRFRTWLAGRPVLFVAGNHDFIDLGVVLRASGVDAQAITLEGLEAHGRRWAGFREIPHMSGEWPGEAKDFGELVQGVAAARPDILVTHAPPSVAEVREGYGVPGLMEAAHHEGLRAHFFGHDHEGSCHDVTYEGVPLFNGAERAIVHELKT